MRTILKIRNLSRSIKSSACWVLWGAIIFALIVSATPLANPVRADGHDHADFDHVFIIMMENTGYNSLVGNPNAPFINFVAATIPDYVWISPDQCNDMHGRGGDPALDSCAFANVSSLISTGDTFLLNTVNAIMTSKAWTGNSVIFITWDESDFTGTGPSGFGDTSGCCNANPGGGHVLTLVISRTLRFARSSDDAFNHYSMMATIEDNWHLGCLANTCDRQSVRPMRDLVGPVGGF